MVVGTLPYVERLGLGGGGDDIKEVVVGLWNVCSLLCLTGPFFEIFVSISQRFRFTPTTHRKLEKEVKEEKR